MNAPIKTSQGHFSGEATKGQVIAKFKAQIWPEVMLKLTPEEARAIGQLLIDLGYEAATK